MPTAAVFVSDFLAYSKTFIYEELKEHIRYDVEVFARSRLNEDRFPFDPVHVAGSLYNATRVSPLFDRLFRQRRYDLVHAHFGTVGAFALRYARKHGVPLVVTFHGFDVPLLASARRFRPDSWGYAVFGKRMLQQMTLGLCASRELRELLLDLGVPKQRLRVHRLGIDLDAFKPAARGAKAPGAVRVMMIGRMVEKKGFQYGIRAFAEQAVDHPRAHLTIVGGGKQEAALRTLVDTLELGERVTFAGILPSAEVAETLRASDVLLAPSVVAADGDRESGLMVIKEAGASEVASIGTYHGGIPEIIEDGRTGFLVPERDVEALSDRLGRLLADPELRARMAEAARHKMLREYDNRERVAELETRYDEALELYAQAQAR